MDHADTVILWSFIGAIAGLLALKGYGDQAAVIGCICGGFLCVIVTDVWCEEDDEDD